MTTNTTVNETPRNDLDRLRAHRKADDVSKAKRIRKIMKAYLPLPRDEQVMAAIKDLMEHMAMALDQMGDGEARGRLTEGRVIVVVGLSGTGKTTVLQHAFAQVEALAGHADAHGDSMLVSMVAPSPGVSKQVALTLARRLGFDTKRNLQESQAWDLVRRQLVLRGVRFVHIDELQHVHQVPNPIEIQKVRDTLKNLVQNRDWPVSLILSGTPDIAAFLQADTQLRRRCVFVRFDSLDPRRDVAVVRSIVKQYCACGGLKQDGLVRDVKDESDRTTDEVVLRLIHASLGEIGTVIEMVQDAATLAIRADDEVLSLKHFVKAYENRTGCASTQNVFLATDWQIIRVEAALYPERVLEEEERRDNRDKKRGRVA